MTDVENKSSTTPPKIQPGKKASANDLAYYLHELVDLAKQAERRQLKTEVGLMIGGPLLVVGGCCCILANEITAGIICGAIGLLCFVVAVVRRL